MIRVNVGSIVLVIPVILNSRYLFPRLHYYAINLKPLKLSVSHSECPKEALAYFLLLAFRKKKTVAWWY